MSGATDAGPATEVFFYHLERTSLEQALPELLERTLQRGWRAVVRADTAERVEALNALLWTYSDASFLPHGARADGHAAEQPIYLATEEDEQNGASVCFLVDGADVADPARYNRVVYLFDGHNPEAVTAARERWKRAKGLGLTLSYWQQTAEGRWQKRA